MNNHRLLFAGWRRPAVGPFFFLFHIPILLFLDVVCQAFAPLLYTYTLPSTEYLYILKTPLLSYRTNLSGYNQIVCLDPRSVDGVYMYIFFLTTPLPLYPRASALNGLGQMT